MGNKIYIIGSGAIGKALAVFLTHQQKEVVLIRGSVDDGTHYKENIQVVLADERTLSAEINTSTLSNYSKLDGIVVLTNKSFGNKKLATQLRDKVTGPIVILQNGLGVEQPFLDLDFEEVYRCVLFATSQIDENGSLRFKPVAVSPVGVIKGRQISLDAVINAINTIEFQFRAEPDIQRFIWKKTIANCVFNSICPLLDVDNGIFHRNGNVLLIAQRIVKECITISQLSGVMINEKEVIDNILLISKASDGQLISTLQDIRNKRQTEIDTLNFEIVRIAAKLGRSNEVNETKLLGELVKMKSDFSRV